MSEILQSAFLNQGKSSHLRIIRSLSDLPAESNSGLAPALEVMHRYGELTGLPLMCVDSATAAIYAVNDSDILPYIPVGIQLLLPEVTELRIFEPKSGVQYFAIPLPDIDGSHTVAVGFVFHQSGAAPSEIVFAAAEANWSQGRLNDWMTRQPHCHPKILKHLLLTAFAQVQEEHRNGLLMNEIDQLTEQLHHTYEEIYLLHTLARNLQISRSPATLASVCLERMHELVRSEGSVIWLEEPNGETHFLSAGNIPFHASLLVDLLSKFEGHNWSRPVVRNHLEATPLGKEFPGLKNMIIVRISQGTHCSGWIISTNALHDQEFGTVEANLMNSVATILGTHLRNIELYREHEELLVSFVQSLVSTLDAKDPYTRGHSERVAMIARRLGEQLHLPEADLQAIYLSGLLHDIGKIGVDDRILRKPGQLTDEEFQQIQLHPSIGFEILKGIKTLQHVLPGVRSHHESYNGRGYPDKLQGAQIPLMARILAVADSYDAMGSDRPYRKGMPVEKIESIFKNGSGSQWDPAIIEAYFAARHDIRELCQNYSLDKRLPVDWHGHLPLPDESPAS